MHVKYILDCMCYVKSVYRLLHSALKAWVSKKVHYIKYHIYL
jgi:hypothetical protein